jgi:hypothetical protein
MTTFFRVLQADEKAQALLSAVRDPTLAASHFTLDIADLAAIPGSPFAYWISPSIRRLFRSNSPVASQGVVTKCGLGTLDDFRFLRTWWASERQAGWRPFIKGERSVPWYGAQSLTVKWRAEGDELKRFVEAKVGSASRKVQARGG